MSPAPLRKNSAVPCGPIVFASGGGPSSGEKSASATARSRFTFLGEQPDGTFRVTGSGIYTDSWVREDGEWRIKSRTVDWDLLAGASAAGAESSPPGAQGGASAAPSGGVPAKRN